MQRVGYKGELLDTYLASGWYRMGVRMFTCRYNFYEAGFLTALWTRLPLAGHAFPKRTRKLVRRAGRALRYEIHPARALAAEEAVFRAYTAHKDYDLHDAAADYLVCDESFPFDTWQVSVYDGEVLVAFSYFDRGRTSAQSVCGFYDPAYAKYSPGVYTLALEVEQCRAWGYDYHYAGYVVPDNDTFEYKRRVGALECFDDVAKRWYPLADLVRDDLPDAVQRRALSSYVRLVKSANLLGSVTLRPHLQVAANRPELSFLKEEQIPFCVAEERSNMRPFWANHFYSYTHRQFVSVLCTEHGGPRDRHPSRRPLMRGRQGGVLYPHAPSSHVVRVLHRSSRPYTLDDLRQVWFAVDLANREA